MSDDFDTPETPTVHREVIFMVDLDGYEGPLDVLLSLARDQKLDITQISILALADQYLKFIAAAQQKNLEIAADYLVMAAWLAYMKSRLLLPDLGGEDEPTGEEMAAALAFQIKRLEAMQEAGHQLMARPRQPREQIRRGTPILTERQLSMSHEGRPDSASARERLSAFSRNDGRDRNPQTCSRAEAPWSLVAAYPGVLSEAQRSFSRARASLAILNGLQQLTGLLDLRQRVVT